MTIFQRDIILQQNYLTSLICFTDTPLCVLLAFPIPAFQPSFEEDVTVYMIEFMYFPTSIQKRAKHLTFM